MSRIYVLAGVNGAGKSSIGGAAFRAFGADYYNPDESARRILAGNPQLNQAEANSRAWHAGRQLLERAIADHLDYAFETTLGAATIPRLLAQAANGGIEVHVWYVGLATADLHVARVRARVARGGHDIPENVIRRRFEHSRMNLIELMPRLTALRVYDNSTPADPAAGKPPLPELVLHMERSKVMNSNDLAHTPDWAKSIVAAAMKQSFKG
jgi:predicted ABC-type ATPase